MKYELRAMTAIDAAPPRGVRSVNKRQISECSGGGARTRLVPTRSPHPIEPGETVLRSDAIAMAIRRIGMCEQAGTGLRMLQREWQVLGHATPSQISDDAQYRPCAIQRRARELLLPGFAISPPPTPLRSS